MASINMFLTMFSLCYLISLIHGRTLTFMPMHDTTTYNYSIISMPPSQAPNANSPPTYVHYNLAPSPSNDNGDDNNKNSTSNVVPTNNVFDVRTFGAIGDGLTDDTFAFKSAWDAACACEADSSAMVFAPKGYSFMIQAITFTGPCKNGVLFQIEGTIMPPGGPEAWPKNSSKKQWLIFYRIHGLTFQGGGLVDGRGDKWWNLSCKPHKGINGTKLPGPCDSPVAMRFFGSVNVILRGMRIMNSPQFHIRFDGCQNVTVDSLLIKSPGNSPNTDGIHVENTNDVKIHNSVISNGDDCISIGAGSHNLDIRNITCGPSHGISIGSLGAHSTKACVSNITVSDCVIKHSDNGVRIKTWQGGYGSVSGVTFQGIHMDTVRNPIIIDQYYCLSNYCSNQTSAVSINTISYSNIKGTYDPRTTPVRLACSDSVPCTNITLSGLELLPAGPTNLATGHRSRLEPFCWKAYGSNLQQSTTPPVYCLLEGSPYLGIPGTDIGQC